MTGLDPIPPNDDLDLRGLGDKQLYALALATSDRVGQLNERRTDRLSQRGERSFDLVVEVMLVVLGIVLQPPTDQFSAVLILGALLMRVRAIRKDARLSDVARLVEELQSLEALQLAINAEYERRRNSSNP